MLKRTSVAIGLLFQTACTTLQSAAEPPSEYPPASSDVCTPEITSCRKLTASEIALARTIFGNTIDYGAVHIHKHFNSINRMVTGATAPDGNIYIHKRSLWSDDYGEASLSHMEIFAHEMTHVWQWQDGLDMISSTLRLWLKQPFNYGAAYKYELDGRVFNRYSHEQQAQIVQHYFVNMRLAERLAGKDGPEERMRAEFCEKAARLETLLRAALPLSPRAGCEKPGRAMAAPQPRGPAGR